MTYLTADQWHAILMRHRKACQRIIARDGDLPVAQWEVLGRVTFLAQATMLDDKPRDRHGGVAPVKIHKMNDDPQHMYDYLACRTPKHLPGECPECNGDGEIPSRLLTTVGLNNWHDGPEYEYVTCDVCGGTGLDCSDNDEVEERDTL